MSQFKKFSVDIVVMEGMQEKVLSLLKAALADKLYINPSEVVLNEKEVVKRNISKSSNLVLITKKDLLPGSTFIVDKTKNYEVKKTQFENCVVNYKYSIETEELVSNGMYIDPMIIDLDKATEFASIPSYLNYNVWKIYNLKLGETLEDDKQQIFIGDRKLGKFALKWIDVDFRNSYNIFLAGKLEKDDESFQKKRKKYIKYFIHHLRNIKEKPKFIPLFSEFLEWIWDYHAHEISDPEVTYGNIFNTEGRLFMDEKEINMFLDAFHERLTHKDLITIIESNQGFKVNALNSSFSFNFFTNLYKRFGLLNEKELKVFAKPHDVSQLVKELVMNQVMFINRTNSNNRLKNDSWCYQIFRNFYFQYVAKMNADFNTERINREEYLEYIRPIIHRYCIIKELPSVINHYIDGDLLDEIKVMLWEGLDNIHGLEKLTLNSIVGSNPNLGTIKLFDSVPSEYKNIRKAILEVKLKK